MMPTATVTSTAPVPRWKTTLDFLPHLNPAFACRFYQARDREGDSDLFLLPGLELTAKLGIPKHGLLLFKEVQVES